MLSSFHSSQDASKALVNLHDKLVRGRKLVVTFAQQSTIPQDVSQLASKSSGRRGTDTSRPTTLSLIKTHGRPNNTSDKIAALEAKLKQMKTPKAGESVLTPEAAFALGVLPPRPSTTRSSSPSRASFGPT